MNFIQKYNINRQLNHFLEQEKKENMQVCSWEQAQNICLLYTFETAELLEQLMESLAPLREKKDNITLFCYVPKKEKQLITDTAAIHFILKKDFDFKGGLKKEKYSDLQQQSFDLLIHLDKEPSLFSLYLAGKIKAKFRIGRDENAKKYNDLILFSSDERFSWEDYFQSVEKYTKKIV